MIVRVDDLRADRNEVRISSLIGTTVEWYDFFLYGTITGLVFNKLFFPAGNAFVATMLAYTVYAVGFVTRPGFAKTIDVPANRITR